MKRSRLQCVTSRRRLNRQAPCCACGRRLGPLRLVEDAREPVQVHLCRHCNDEREALGLIAFQRRHAVDLEVVANGRREEVAN